MLTVKEILEKKKEREKELKLALESVMKKLIDFGASKIILFGSLVKGEVDEQSDLDLLAIMPSTRSGKEWMKFIYENVERDIASEIVVFNQKEFAEKLPGSSFLENILTSGRVIYEKTL